MNIKKLMYPSDQAHFLWVDNVDLWIIQKLFTLPATGGTNQTEISLVTDPSFYSTLVATIVAEYSNCSFCPESDRMYSIPRSPIIKTNKKCLVGLHTNV